ncbi:MAG: TRAP transporter small permease [Beijerinckiaceae bacterium]|jgi:TRAP-type C4-dicarboxylate transport system permease small subunit|nr:TRAP transporter small permease [Beijerinckiaceae bacterium]
MLHRIHRSLDILVLTLAVPMTLVMLACVVWQVVGRYFLNSSTSFTDELSRFLFIWVSLLGAAYVLGKRGHIAITGLIDMAPRGVRRGIDILIAGLVIVFALVVLGWGGWLLVERNLRLGQVTPAMLVPVAYVYLIIPLSGLLTAIYATLVVCEVASGQEIAAKEVSLD